MAGNTPLLETRLHAGWYDVSYGCQLQSSSRQGNGRTVTVRGHGAPWVEQPSKQTSFWPRRYGPLATAFSEELAHPVLLTGLYQSVSQYNLSNNP
jgi:hypothetical protein